MEMRLLKVRWDKCENDTKISPEEWKELEDQIIEEEWKSDCAYMKRLIEMYNGKENV
jgi:hypothetical protein